MIYVLDACAMIAFLTNEPGADVVEQALLDAGSQCAAHSINLCEVFYHAWRKGGETEATKAIDDLRAVGITERDDFDQTFWREVGKIKATQVRVSLADCCAIVLTNRVGGRFSPRIITSLTQLRRRVCAISPSSGNGAPRRLSRGAATIPSHACALH